MDELEEIKKKKLMEMMAKESSQNNESEAAVQAQIAQLEGIVKQTFTKSALERYGNIKIAYPEKAVSVLIFLAQGIQSGQIQQIDDEKLKSILFQLTPKKKEFKIKRK